MARVIERRPSAGTGAPRGWEPVWVGEVDIAGPLPSLHPVKEDGAPYRSARLLVRLATEPLGFVEVPLPMGADDLALELLRACGDQVAARGGPVGLTGPGANGLGIAGDDVRARKWAQHRADVLARAPVISVIVCTRNRPDGLALLLDAIAKQEYPNFEVIVVDNAAEGPATRDIVAGYPSGRVRYVSERRPGLSWARNAGLAAAYGSIVAYIDDDEMPDLYWLAELACGFAAARDVAAVGGLIISASLETKAEQVFEALGGHSKGRGFTREIFDVPSHRLQHPLYPLPFFAAGGNMAFRRTVLEDIGGFDVALGAGTRAKGAEDTAAVADVMMRGGTVVWQPSAFVYHRHYASFAGAERQVYGYGVGITAFYARVVLRSPRHIPQLVRLTVEAARDVFRPRSLRNAGFNGDAPELAALRAARRRGMANGPLAYVRSTLEQRRLAHEWSG